MQGLAKALKRLELPTNPKSKPSPTCRKNKTYEQMDYPGQRIQIDVKYVPKECLSPQFIKQYNSAELYQYTAIDEYSRYRILCGYREHNTYSSSLFLCQVISAFRTLGIEVECVQTDNGSEFTKTFHTKDKNNRSMFEVTAKRLGVKLKRIKPHTPKHNGKVERSHREDQKLFYSEIIRLNRLITDEEDFKQRLKRHQRKTNDRPMRPLGYLSPKKYLENYLSTKRKEAKEK
jgi:transposase InsO family protein